MAAPEVDDHIVTHDRIARQDFLMKSSQGGVRVGSTVLER
jgi:hypothetical protein